MESLESACVSVEVGRDWVCGAEGGRDTAVQVWGLGQLWDAPKGRCTRSGGVRCVSLGCRPCVVLTLKHKGPVAEKHNRGL